MEDQKIKGEGHGRRLAECEQITTGLQKEIDSMKIRIDKHTEEAKPYREEVRETKVFLMGVNGKGGLVQDFKDKFDRFDKVVLGNIATIIMAVLAFGVFYGQTMIRLEKLEKVYDTAMIPAHYGEPQK